MLVLVFPSGAFEARVHPCTVEYMRVAGQPCGKDVFYTQVVCAVSVGSKFL